MTYDKEKLIDEVASELAHDGGTQFDVARNGFKGVLNMTDAEIKTACDYHGIECNSPM